MLFRATCRSARFHAARAVSRPTTFRTPREGQFIARTLLAWSSPSHGSGSVRAARSSIENLTSTPFSSLDSGSAFMSQYELPFSSALCASWVLPSLGGSFARAFVWGALDAVVSFGLTARLATLDPDLVFLPALGSLLLVGVAKDRVTSWRGGPRRGRAAAAVVAVSLRFRFGGIMQLPLGTTIAQEVQGIVPRSLARFKVPQIFDLEVRSSQSSGKLRHRRCEFPAREPSRLAFMHRMQLSAVNQRRFYRAMVALSFVGVDTAVCVAPKV